MVRHGGDGCAQPIPAQLLWAEEKNELQIRNDAVMLVDAAVNHSRPRRRVGGMSRFTGGRPTSRAGLQFGPMSPRSKYNIAFVLWAIFVFLWVLSLYSSWPFGMLFLLPMVAAGMYAMRMGCPFCENPFFYVPSWSNRTKPIFPLPERCPRCGGDLSKPPPKANASD